MTLLEAAKQALDALEHGWVERGDDVAIALRQAIENESRIVKECKETMADLEQAEKQEPVAWLDSDGFPWSKEGIECRSTPDTYRPLYLAPYRNWVGLTDDDLENMSGVELKYIGTGEYVIDGEYEFAKEIEAKLKENNT